MNNSIIGFTLNFDIVYIMLIANINLHLFLKLFSNNDYLRVIIYCVIFFFDIIDNPLL